MQHESDAGDHQGQQYQFIGFDELTSFEESQYEYVAFSRARRRVGLAEAGVTMRAENAVELSGEDAIRMQKLLDALENLDDVQEVFTNAAL